MPVSSINSLFERVNFKGVNITNTRYNRYRIVALVRKEGFKIPRRPGLHAKISAVARALKQVKYEAITDGEVVVLDENDNPDFSALQNYREGNTIVFCLFDLLWCNGYNLMSLHLTERKDLLKQVIPESDIIKFSESFDDGIGLFEILS